MMDTQEGSNRSGWLTGVKDQEDCGACWAFTTIGAVEAYLNIYYNTHDKTIKRHYDIDLSEQELVSCSGYGTCAGGQYDYALFWLTSHKSVEDTCFRYTATNSSCIYCSNYNWMRKVGISSKASCSQNEDLIKEALIKNGPLASGYSPADHAMVLTGWSTTSYGTTVWNFKNSYGYNSSNPVFREIECSVQDISNPDKIAGGLTFEGFTTPVQHLCTDEDGDGYYWWGTGPHQGCGCPSTVTSDSQEDCDDFDKDAGPYNTSNQSLPLYSCLENCPDGTYLGTDYYFTQNPYYFNHQERINNNLHIANNQTVYVSASLYMNPQAYVKIESGGKLIIDQTGSIKSQCNRLWQGITVCGTNGQQSNSQGRIEVYGSVEDAVTGIKTFPENGGTGAIIIADAATFLNNRTSIMMMPYFQDITLSRITNCSFVTLDTLSDGSNPSAFISLKDQSQSDNHRLHISGCQFETTQTRLNQTWRTNTGIDAVNSKFVVSAGNSSLQKTFRGLKYGIHAQGTSPDYVPFEVTGYDFTNNERGIYASAIANPKIESNTFLVPHYCAPTVSPDQFNVYGIYLENSKGYSIKNNTLTGPYANTQQPLCFYRSCGIYVKNSSDVVNKIVLNTVSHFNTGISAFGINRDQNHNGLEIKCNTFSDNVSDIGVYRGALALTGSIGIKDQQGKPDSALTSELAGNQFTSPIDCGYHMYDLDNTYCNFIQYNHHAPNINNYNPRLRPDLRSANVTPHPFLLLSFNQSQSCPPSVNLSFSDISALWTNLSDAKSSYDSLTTQVNLLTDGGKTDSVNTAILFSMPSDAWALYLDLMSKSPYLSDTVLKSAVLKDAVLINAMIRDILVANPQAAKSDSIIQLINERYIPMSDTMLGEILEGRNFLGAKELLEINRSNRYTEYNNTFNELMNIYLTDTTHENLGDSIDQLLQGDFRITSKYSLAFRKMELGNTHDADEIINSIPSFHLLNSYQQEEHQRYMTYYNCVKRAIQYDTTLTFDSIQISRLDSLVSTDTNYYFLPTVYAKNSLLSAGLMGYDEKLYYDSAVQPQHAIHEKYVTPENNESYLKIYPNPASDYIVIDYNYSGSRSEVAIGFCGINGQVFKSVKIQRFKDQKIIDIHDIPNGLYIISLVNGKKNLVSQKLIIQR